MDDQQQDTTIFVTSGYGGNTRRPFVSVRVGDRAPMQISVEEARDFALNLLSGAEAAEQDAFLVETAMSAAGMTMEQAGMFLRMFREARAQKERG